MSVVDKVQHYQRSIEKCWDNEERMMHCISKLYQLPVTVQHLRDTGVGRTVNSLRKYDGGVGDAAKALVAKWKAMVASEDSSEAEDEDEACVPDAPESYSDTPESPKRDETSTNDITRHSNQESKERDKIKSNKSGSFGHGSKHPSKGHVNSEVPHSKDADRNNVHKDRNSKTESKDREQRHESKTRKSTSRHDTENDSKLKSSKEVPPSDKKGYDSKDNDKPDSDIGKVSSSTESYGVNGKDSHRKRKQERSGSNKEVNKKNKYSESESEEDNSRPGINSLTVSEPDSLSGAGLESLEVLNTESDTNKSALTCDKPNARKELSEKEKKRDSEKDDARYASKSEAEKESPRTKDLKKGSKRKHGSHNSSKHSSKSKSSHSSSSSKDPNKNDDTAEKKDKKHKHERRSRTSESKDNLKDQKVKKKIKLEKEDDEGIDSQSGTSFAEALGMCMMPPPSRKRNSNAPSASIEKSIKIEPGTSADNKPLSLSMITQTEDVDSESNPPSLLAPNVKLEPLSVDLAATLPEISPNYKPLAYNLNPIHRKLEEGRTLSEVLYSKNQRTKVFSGNKTGYTNVPSLYELCIRVLIENIDALEVTGGVPYFIIKPVLDRATPDQLYMLEHHNPYLIEDTDPLWQYHCNREFRNKKREEMESWREMYMRCLDEREAKLKALTANIKQSIDKSQPVRSTIRVHDDCLVKPPRSVLRKQAKYGTAKDLPTTASEIKKKLISGGGQSNTSNSCQPSAVARLKATSSSIGKKTKAPLMAKALQLIKGRYKR